MGVAHWSSVIGHWSFYRLLVAVVGWVILSPTPSRAADPALTAWLSAQINLQTWSAEVIQTRTLKTLTQPLTNTGHIWFAARPELGHFFAMRARPQFWRNVTSLTGRATNPG